MADDGGLTAYLEYLANHRYGVPIVEADKIDTMSRWDVLWAPPRPRNAWERWSRKLRVFRIRARDAWLVLQGKADIDGEW